MPNPTTEGPREGRRLEERVGQIIRSARLARDVTQEALAEAISMSRTNLVNLEGGKQGIPLRVIYDIAYALDVSVHDLLPDAPYNTSTVEELAECKQRLADMTRRFDRAKDAINAA